MKNDFGGKSVVYFTILTAFLVTVASLGGLLGGNMYEHETTLWVAQAVAQDIVDLVLIVPVILISGFLLRAGKRTALFVWLGAMLYTAYTFIIYTFGVHFNSLFLIYCWVLGLSVYGMLTISVRTAPVSVKAWFDQERHEYLISIFVLAAGVLFYLMWLKEDLPAMISDQAPASLQGTGLITNPVHVLDLSLILPGFIVTSILLIKKHSLGYLFTPVLLVFAILMDITIAIMVISIKSEGLADNINLAAIFLIFALAGAAVLVSFLRHMKKPAVQQEVHGS